MKLANALINISIISALVGCGEIETASSHIEKAKTFKSNEIDSKLISLKNAVKIEPKNSEARYLLGEAYLSVGFGVGAVKELEKAYDYDYDKNKVVPLLARSYTLLSSNEEAIDLDKHLTLLSNDSSAQYLAYRTLSAIRLQNIELAKASYEQARSLLPNSAYTFLSKAYLDMGENNLGSAKGNVDKTLEILPKQPDALLLLGQINTASQNHSEATNSYMQYAKLQPKSNVIVLFLSQSLLKEGKYLEAERYADTLLKASPNQPFAHYVKATSQFELKNYQKAKEHSESALKAQFNQGPLKLIAGISSYFLGNYEQSHYHLESVVQYLVPEHPARKMFAVSQLQLGMLNDISDTLQGFKSKTTEDEKFLSSLSYQLAELGAVDNAKMIAKQAMSTAPVNAEQNVRDGILKLMLNDPSGMQNLKDAVALEPNLLGAELALAYAAIQAKDYKQAVGIATKWKQKYPNKPAGYNVLAAVYLKQNDKTNAKLALSKSLEISKNNVFALLELTNLAMIEGDVKEAKRLSSIAVEELPKNIKILNQHYSLNRDEVAFEKIKALYKSDETNLSYGLLYTEVLIEKKKFNEAVNVVDAYETSVKSPKKLWQLKVVSHSALKNTNKAQTILEDWIKVNPYHIEPIVLLADFASRKNDTRKALSIIERALNAEHKNSTMLMVGKMQLLLESNLLSDAKSYYEDIKNIGLDKVVVNGIEGKIALLEKDYAKASLLLSSFYDANPTSNNVIMLSTALQGNNQEVKAVQHLESYLEDHSRDDNVRAFLANIYINSNSSKAIDAYKIILKNHPENIMVLNNVAWLSMESGDLQAALAYSDMALKIAPKVVNVIDTQAMILLKLDRKSEALSQLVKAYELSKGKNNDVTLNYIEALIANKRLKKAEQMLATIENATYKQKQRLLLLSKLLKS